LTQEYLSRLQGRLEKTFQASGMESDLGVKLEELREGMVRLSLATAEKHGNVYGIVHGGILASLCDNCDGNRLRHAQEAHRHA
jgi:acyl-coenzyme A thioesterase PaaI-like protein